MYVHYVTHVATERSRGRESPPLIYWSHFFWCTSGYSWLSGLQKHIAWSCWASHQLTPPSTSPQGCFQSILHPGCICAWHCPNWRAGLCPWPCWSSCFSLRTFPNIRSEQWLTVLCVLQSLVYACSVSVCISQSWEHIWMKTYSSKKVILSAIHSPGCPGEDLQECWCWHCCGQHRSVMVAANAHVATGKMFVKPDHHTWQHSSFISYFLAGLAHDLVSFLHE